MARAGSRHPVAARWTSGRGHSVREYQAGYLKRLKGQVDLVYRDGIFFLYATIEVPEETLMQPTRFLGGALGIANIATDSDGPPYTGEAIQRVRLRSHTARKTYQAT